MYIKDSCFYTSRDLASNEISFLPAGIFNTLTALEWL